MGVVRLALNGSSVRPDAPNGWSASYFTGGFHFRSSRRLCSATMIHASVGRRPVAPDSSFCTALQGSTGRMPTEVTVFHRDQNASDDGPGSGPLCGVPGMERRVDDACYRVCRSGIRRWYRSGRAMGHGPRLRVLPGTGGLSSYQLAFCGRR